MNSSAYCQPHDCCPTCGQTAPPIDIAVDLNNHAFIINGKSGKLAEIPLIILYTLARRYPNSIRYDSLLAAIYGAGEEPDDAANSLKVQVSRLRVTLAQYGAGIESIWGYGYRLVPRVTVFEKRYKKKALTHVA